MTLPLHLARPDRLAPRHLWARLVTGFRGVMTRARAVPPGRGYVLAFVLLGLAFLLALPLAPTAGRGGR